MNKQLFFVALLGILATCGSEMAREATPEEREHYKKIIDKKWVLVFKTGRADISKGESYSDFIFNKDSTYKYRILYSVGDTGEYDRYDDVVRRDEHGKRIKTNTWHISGDTLFTKMGSYIIQKLTGDSLELEHLRKKKPDGHRRIYITKN